ncbi:NAD(P)H-quinone oxidoreductase subunit 2, chloroplastic [Candidatus Entotheonellaceae bacterium PAL068K]
MSSLHPGFILFLVALGVALTRGHVRRLVLLAGPLLTLLAAWQLTPANGWSLALPQYQLQLLQVDALSHVFGLIFSLITCIGVLYAWHVSCAGEHIATLVYAGAALGVVFAGDWMTLFVFWELMAVASLFVIWNGGSNRSWSAGFRYLLVHIFGGSLLLCGILLYVAHDGDVNLQALTRAPQVPVAAFWLMLLGVAINAAIPPLHAWLTDTYPEASVTGSVFLSAFTTKTAVYVLIRLFPGAEILLWAGVIMALYGVVYAVLENDTRRLLAYHIISQVGYMVAAVGMGTPMAINGAVAHAFCHILYKALLFMGAGVVIVGTGKRKLTELGGIAQCMPLVVMLYMVGAFSISGVPLFNGFISKSMVISAAAQKHLPLPEILLTLASIGTFLSIGLKLPYFIFFGPDRGLRPRPRPRNMVVAMGLGALLCTALGVFPGWLYARLPFPVAYHPYTVDHVVSALQLLLGTGLGFWLLLSKLGGEPTVSTDTDWVYRKPLVPVCNAMIVTARRLGASLEQARTTLLRGLIPYVQNPFLAWTRLGPNWRVVTCPPALQAPADDLTYDENRYRLPIGVTVFWIVVFFASMALYTL